MIKLSIILPIYNVESYLQRCLESITTQIVDDTIEIIGVNDGSTDSSYEILKEYQKKYSYISIINQSNQGLSAARNAGLKKAKGEFVFFLDSDDYVDVYFLKKITPYLLQENDVVMFNAQVVNEKTGVISKYKPLLHKTYTIGLDFFLNYLLQGHEVMICAWSKLYRRDFLLSNNLYFKSGLLHEDELFTPIMCFYADRILVINEYLYNYSVREGSIMRKTQLKRLTDVIWIANKLGHFFLTKKIYDAVVWKHIFNLYYLQIIKCREWDIKNGYTEIIRNIDVNIYNITSVKCKRILKAKIMYYFPRFFSWYYLYKIKLYKK